MTVSSPTPAVKVRLATPADLGDVVKLLSARDGQPRDMQTVGQYLWDIDSATTCIWLAYAGDQPVGITMLYLRRMLWPDGEDRKSESADSMLAGYWAHLYVDPEFRKQMVYPQLVLAMIRGMQPAGISILFTATRQPQVAEAHQKLGFALVGTMPLRLRPLRPFRLLAKHKGAAMVAPLCAPLDSAYRFATRRRCSSSVKIDHVDLNSSEVEEIVALLNTRDERAVRQVWTVDQFRRRFCTTLDGSSYRITAIRQQNHMVAALVMALAERRNKILAGVLLELVAATEATPGEVAALLADAEGFAHSENAELMLSLEGSLGLVQLESSGNKFMTTHSETYHLLVYPKNLAQAPHAAADFQQWQFAFADHDAF